MLKAGIFLDMENLSRNGGWGIRYEVVKDLVEAQGTTVLRANAYLAVDVERERQDSGYRIKNENYRAAIRRNGFHLIRKEVRRYYDSEGELVVKANADLDLAVDALLQAENLDYILLGSGDGDFLRLVRALQNRGKRVDLLSFANTSGDLIREVDNHFSGFLIPGALGSESHQSRKRGVLHAYNEDKGYGFITMRTGLKVGEVRYDIFCHINDVSSDDGIVDSHYMTELKLRQIILEFDLIQTQEGLKALNVREFQWR